MVCENNYKSLPAEGSVSRVILISKVDGRKPRLQESLVKHIIIHSNILNQKSNDNDDDDDDDHA